MPWSIRHTVFVLMLECIRREHCTAFIFARPTLGPKPYVWHPWSTLNCTAFDLHLCSNKCPISDFSYIMSNVFWYVSFCSCQSGFLWLTLAAQPFSRRRESRKQRRSVLMKCLWSGSCFYIFRELFASHHFYCVKPLLLSWWPAKLTNDSQRKTAKV